MKVPWTSVFLQVPHAKRIIVKTRTGAHFIHIMTNKNGELVPWRDQDEKWTDGKFEYGDVMFWCEL